jgi:hypothetical protein
MTAQNFLTPMVRRLAACAAAGAFVVTPCAMARAAHAEAPGDRQRARLGEICVSSLGVRPGQAQQAGCIDSLAQSLQDLGRGDALWTARDACLGQGLTPGSSDLSVCTLRSAKSDQGGLAVTLPREAAAPVPGGAKPYAYASNQDRFAREQLACAEIGLQPVSGAFDSCVASLAAALFAADNPAQ